MLFQPPVHYVTADFPYIGGVDCKKLNAGPMYVTSVEEEIDIVGGIA